MQGRQNETEKERNTKTQRDKRSNRMRPQEIFGQAQLAVELGALLV